jgi:small-conductance mechanosensitive channel
MRKLTKRIGGTLALAGYWLMAAPVLALEERKIDIRPKGKEFGPLGNITIPALVSASVMLILVIAALVAFVFLVIGGIKWVTSGGDKEKTAKAQQTLTAALIGLVIVFAAWAIIRLIETFFGIHILTLEIPTVGQ